MRYVVILEETIVHRVELEANSYEQARRKARDQWMDRVLCNVDPYFYELRVLEVRTEEENGA